MPDAISNTSPLLYLHRIGRMNWLHELFTGTYVPGAVVFESMLVPGIEPLLNRLEDSGMWISERVRQRILALAGEKVSQGG
jgi:predicted nucleic acid-binding protein